MRSELKFFIGVGVAIVAMAGVGGANVVAPSASAQAIHPHVVVAINDHPSAAILSDRQLILATAPARAAAAQVAALAVAQHTAEIRAAAARSAQARKVQRPAAHTLNVWTDGFQAQINACRGGVDVTAHYKIRVVAEHWSCGGSAFPTRVGTIVRFTGLDAGTYEVLGIVATINAYAGPTRAVPRDYGMMFQTCRGGDGHYTEFIGLKRIN